MKGFYVETVRMSHDENLCLDGIDFIGTSKDGQYSTIRFIPPKDASILSMANIVYSLLDTGVQFNPIYHDDSLLGLFARFYNAVDNYGVSDRGEFKDGYSLGSTYDQDQMFNKVADTATNDYGFFQYNIENIIRRDIQVNESSACYYEIPAAVPSDVLVAISYNQDLLDELWLKNTNSYRSNIASRSLNDTQYYEEVLADNSAFKARSKETASNVKRYLRSEWQAKRNAKLLKKEGF